MDMKRRIKNIFSQEGNKADLIVIKNGSEPFIDTNFFYVTGIDKGLFEGCTALLYPNGEVELIVSELEAGLAEKTDYNIIIYKKRSEFLDTLRKSLKNYKQIGVNYDGVSYKTYQFFKDNFIRKEFVDISENLTYARRIKENEEIDKIKKACKISDKVAEKIPGISKKGMKEYELAAEIDYLLEKNGAESPAFLTISSFGKNSALPHYSHGNYKLKNGDIILCDFGASFKKYNSDITRVFIMGNSTKKQKKMYETVLKAQKIGLDSISEEIKGKTVHEKVSEYINNTEFKGKFIHSTGHSLGMDVHDGGVGFNSECDVDLKENMVLTVEPGIYDRSLGGIRIEDDIVVKNNKAKIISKANKDFIEI